MKQRPPHHLGRAAMAVLLVTWLGTPTVGHCGRLIQGQRFEKDQAGQGFRLQALP